MPRKAMKKDKSTYIDVDMPVDGGTMSVWRANKVDGNEKLEESRPDFWLYRRFKFSGRYELRVTTSLDFFGWGNRISGFSLISTPADEDDKTGIYLDGEYIVGDYTYFVEGEQEETASAKYLKAEKGWVLSTDSTTEEERTQDLVYLITSTGIGDGMYPLSVKLTDESVEHLHIRFL